MDNFYDNKYVQVGLPVLMGIAAASSPAGARGAGALLSTLGGLQNVNEGRERREYHRGQLRLAEQQALANQPSPMELAARERLHQTIMAPQSPPPGAEGPTAPVSLEAMERRFENLSSTEGGRYLTMLGGPPSLQRYVQGVAGREARGRMGQAKIPDLGLGETLNAQVFADWGRTLKQDDGTYRQPDPEMVNRTIADREERLQQGRIAVAQQTGAVNAGFTAAAEERRARLQTEAELRREELQKSAELRRAELELQSFRMPEIQQRRLGSLNSALSMAEALDDFSKEDIQKWVGVLRNPAYRFGQLIQEDPKFAAFDALRSRLEAALLFAGDESGGKALTETERKVLVGSVPTGRELGGADQYEAKRRVIQTMLKNKLASEQELITFQPGKPGADLQRTLQGQRARFREEIKQGVPASTLDPQVQDVLQQFTVPAR